MDTDRLREERTASRKPFRGFGPTAYAHGRPALQTLDVRGDYRAVRQLLRAACPAAAGVYGLLDRHGTLIYVGMSRQLRGRLRSYFGAAQDGTKQQRLAEQTQRVVWEVSAHEFTARLRELELIRRWKPRFNVQGRPHRRRVGYVYLTAHEAPQFCAGRTLPQHCHGAWGPVPLGRRTRAAAERLNHVFQLRDCGRAVPLLFADQRQLFALEHQAACLRGDVGTCLAPCAGRCSHAQYGAQLAAARALLEGTDDRVLADLAAAMSAAAEQHQFERAGALRDAWEELSYLVEQVQLVRDVAEHYWFVYPVPGWAGRTLWYLVAGGIVTAVVREPDGAGVAEKCRQLLAAAYERRAEQALRGQPDFEQLRLVASWFRQHPDELDRVLDPDETLARCRAGVSG